MATRLDLAHADMMRDVDDDAARLAYYSHLADAELFVLLDVDPDVDPDGDPDAGDDAAATVQLRLFDLDDGPVVLAFDLEERLAGFVGGPAPYAALPGRVIAAQLAGQGIGLGLNVGASDGSIILPPEVMDWLTTTLGAAPVETVASPQGFSFPWKVPAEVTDRLAEKLGAVPGLAEAVLLAEVIYEGGRRGHILAVLGAAPGAEQALARAASEALVFSGIEAGEIDVVFPKSGDPRLPAMQDVALRLDLPKPEVLHPQSPAGPGMNSEKPPNLR